jgi:hypothetical protein
MTELTHLTFDDFVSQNRFVMIHFWAAWNPHDLRLKKWIKEQIPEEIKNRIALGTVDLDVEEHFYLGHKYKITTLPHLLFFRDGELQKYKHGNADARSSDRRASGVALLKPTTSEQPRLFGRPL